MHVLIVEDNRDLAGNLVDYLEAQQPEVLLEIRTKKALDDDLTGRLKAAIAAFKTLFVAD